MLIQVTTPVIAGRMRAKLPVTSVSPSGHEYVGVPAPITITKIGAGCRACGCPLDVGVSAVRVLLFTGFEKYAVARSVPRTYYYVHAEDCWVTDFVQTMRLNKTDTVRFVGYSVDHEPTVIEAGYTRDPHAWSMPPIPNTFLSLRFTLHEPVNTGISSHVQLHAMQRQARRERYQRQREATRLAREARDAAYKEGGNA